MIDDNIMDIEVEKFYVYRSLHQDESWGAIIIGNNTIAYLPNITFGMKIYAKNEKEAIAKAKANYDKIHAHDGDKDNIRVFAASALKAFLTRGCDIDMVTSRALMCATMLNKKFNKYFKEIEEENNG